MALSTVASLIFRLGADAADFTTDMGRAARVAENKSRRIRESLGAMGTAIAGAAAVAGAALAAAVQQSINEFDNLAKTSQKIGITTESLSTLSYAARQSGVELGTLQNAMTRLAVNANAAATGNNAAAATFRAMGIEVRDSAGQIKTTDRLLREAADRFRQYANTSQEAALATKLFGRAGAELLPLLNAGSEGIAQLEDRARALGLEIGSGAAVQAEVFNDNMADLRGLLKGFVNDVTTQLLPSLSSLARYLADSGIQAREAAGGTNWLADAIKKGVNVFIAFKTAVQQVGVVLAFVVDLVVTSAQRSVESLSWLSEAVDIYSTLFTKGPAEAMRQARVLQSKLIDKAAENVDLIARKFGVLRQSLDDVFEEGYRQFEAFNVVTGETTEAMGDAATAGAALAPVVDTLASASDGAAKAQREHNKALRAAEGALRDAERRYAEYQKRMMDAEDAAVRASQSLTEYLRTSDEWLSGVDDAARDYVDTLNELLRIEKKLEQQGRLTADAQLDLARARENAARILQTRRNEAAGVFGGGLNYLEDVLKNAVRAAFDQRNLSGFFRTLRESVRAAFTQRPGEGRGAFIDRAGQAILQGVSFAQDAVAAWRAGATTLERVANVAAMIPGPIGTIARILQGVNALAGGRLFGTAWDRTGGRRELHVGAMGATGRDVQHEMRQRSLFRGRQWRDVVSQLDADTQRTINALFDNITRAVASSAELLGVEATSIISGSFQQEFDRDGNLTREFGTILGQVFNESFEDFSARLQAENMLAVIASAFPTDGIQEIANRWRDSARELLDGASVLLTLAATYREGTSIFTGSLSDIIDVLDRFGEAGESMMDTYQRIVQAAMSYGQAVASVQEELITANLSQFSRAVLAARRQELQRIDTLNQLARTTGLAGAREQDLARVRAASAARVQVLINELTADAVELVRTLYGAGALDTAGALPGTLDSAADALSGFRQSVQEFIKGLEIDERLSPFGAMERLQRARAMLREAAGRGDLQSAQQLASATLNIGRDLFASGRDYAALFEEVQGILAGVRFVEPPSAAGQDEVATRLRSARELAQAVADLAAEQSLTFEEVAANLGFNLDRLASDLGLSQEGLLSYLESLQADTVDLAQVLTDLPRNIARELAALLQAAVPAEPALPPGTGPGGPGTGPGGPGTGPGGPGVPIPPREDYIDPIGPRDPTPGERFIESMDKVNARLDVLITETRLGNRSNEEALQPIYDELQSQRFLMEDSLSSNRSVR